MTFLAKPLRLDRDAMVSYILAIPTTGFKVAPPGTTYAGTLWSPKGVVWHNTGNPSLGLWDSWSETTKENYINGLDPYYKNMGWHSGPHFMGTPEPWSAVLCDLLSDGVHDSCRNINYYATETVLNAVPGGDDPTTGRGLLAMQASANIIAALCVRFGWNPRTAIDFHRNCKADGHACPGSLVTDDWAIGLVEARIAEIKGVAPAPPAQSPATVAAPAPAPATSPASVIIIPPWPSASNPMWNRVAQIVNALRAKGAENPFIVASIANGYAESDETPKITGDDNQAFSIWQWHWNPRGALILEKTGIDVRTETSISKLVDAFWWEIENIYPKTFAEMKAATSAEDATRTLCVEYEGAGAPNAADRRVLMAAYLAVWITQNEAFIAANPAQ